MAGMAKTLEALGRKASRGATPRISGVAGMARCGKGVANQGAGRKYPLQTRNFLQNPEVVAFCKLPA